MMLDGKLRVNEQHQYNTTKTTKPEPKIKNKPQGTD
jgi:hypothetical protein